MAKIVRTPTKAIGGITQRERELMAEHSQLWVARTMRTDPIDPDKIGHAIRGLYRVSGLREPRVIIVPSPLVMARAGNLSAGLLCRATYDATRAATYATYTATLAATLAATYNATYNATYDATRAATYDATDAATRAATRAATYTATDAATYATYNVTYDATRAATYTATYTATYDATYDATLAATYDATYDATLAETDAATYHPVRWVNSYQGGNMWASNECFLTAFRDILGLQLPIYAKYKYWELAAIHGGFRYIHADFCMVSDFPEILLKDEMHRPHCATGPSHRWRDGWSLYHWHGVRVPSHWIEQRNSLDPVEVLAHTNVEQRAAGAAIIGWPRMMQQLGASVINDSGDPDLGKLVEMELPGVGKGRFLVAECPRNGTIVEGVPDVSDIDGLPITTALAAQAWRIGDPLSEYTHPPRRT